MKLNGPDRAFALLSPKPPDVAAIFVHGFNGSPDKTWVDFEHLIDEIGEQRFLWSTWDLFFYSYKSRNQIAPLAEDLAHLVKAVATRNDRFVMQVGYLLPSSGTVRYGVPLGLLEMRGNGPYKRIYFIGHSTGAVLVRQTICDILKLAGVRVADLGAMARATQLPHDSDYADLLIANASLRFFAPAHAGVMAAGPLGIARSLPIADWIVNSRLRSSPLYQTITPGSPTLSNLRNETERLYQQHKLLGLKAYSIFGENEDVVFIGGYTHDEQAPIEKNQGHRSICKPTLAYTRPLEFVTNEPAIAKRA